MVNERIAQRCICCASTELDRSSAVLMPFVAKRVFGHEPVAITEEWGVRDLRPGMAYTLCMSVQCQHCGALFLDYRFSEEEMRRLYQGYRDEQYNRERQTYEPGYTGSNQHSDVRAAYIADVERWLEPQVPANPAVLDWGGDSGVNTPLLGRSRYTHVYDISAVAPIDGVQAVDLEAIRRHRYDLIVCSEVLEHVSAPYEMLVQIAEQLGEDTLLYLEVPREDLVRDHPGSKGLARLKRHWHEHINFFTEQSMRELVARAGLQVQEVMELDVDVGWRKGRVFGLLAKRGSV